ncbi:MAG: sensor histidine kinase [Myxococcales bacterium]
MAGHSSHDSPDLFRTQLAPDSRERLRDFSAHSADVIRCLADEFATRLLSDPRFADALRVATISETQLGAAVHDWVIRTLTGDESEPSAEHRVPAAGVASSLRPVLLAGIHVGCLSRGLVWLRRQLIQRCASDPDTLAAVVAAVDLELEAIAELRDRDTTERAATLDRLAEIGQLVASVGHELRNPLSAIETSAYLLSQRLTGLAESDPNVGRHLDKIRRQVDKANAVSTALLELARQKPPCCAEVSLSAALRVVLDDLAHPNGVRIEVDVADSLTAWADQEQLRVVLHNLLSNAVESVGASGLVCVTAAECDSGTTLVVSDDGPGIAPEDQLRIFQLLYTNKRGGTGLGLPLCQRIAIAHGGSLTLESRLHGAAFRLWLPGVGKETGGSAPPKEVR